jgi:ectoine hydroxylase-related dioxygenase (phytanoyl-CoA dioxygenase family)
MLKSYGVTESAVVATEAERSAEEVRLTGYAVVRGVFDTARLQAARDKLDRLYTEQAAVAGGEARLRAINDANVVRCPLAHDVFFLDLAAAPRLRAIAAELLGRYVVLQQQNGVINPPDDRYYQAAWHRDLPYQHFVSSRPLAVSALMCIDPFTNVTGGTHVLPGSHRAEPFPSDGYVLTHERGIEAEAGDVLVFDSMLFHRAGTNRSVRPRRGVNNVYGLPFLKQPISLPRALGGRFRDDPDLGRFLGYDTEPADGPADWRNRRLAAIQG